MKALIFPGQGSQAVGMGEGLFERFPQMTECASDTLGFSIEELCLRDPKRLLSSTQYAQPAIYVVNALHLAGFLDTNGLADVAFVAGHSLGEYSALLAADVFNFETGLAIVKKRGELFASVDNGAMAAVVGLSVKRIQEILHDARVKEVDIANLNSDKQIVLSGPSSTLARCKALFEKAGCILYKPLNVSGPFHSRYMTPVKRDFETFLPGFELNKPVISIVSNVTARPYVTEGVSDLTNSFFEYLVEQIDHPVRWNESVGFMLRRGITEFNEIGYGQILTRLTTTINRDLSTTLRTALQNKQQYEGA